MCLGFVTWMWLSGMVLPTSWGPWRLSDKRLWVDKCCASCFEACLLEASLERTNEKTTTSPLVSATALYMTNLRNPVSVPFVRQDASP